MTTIVEDSEKNKFINEMDDKLDTIYKILSLNSRDKSAINDLNKILNNRLDISNSLLPVSKSVEGEYLLTIPKMWMIIILLKLKQSKNQINDFLTLINGSLTRDLNDLSDYKEYFKKQCELLLDDKKAIQLINKNTKNKKLLKFNASHSEVRNNYNYLLIKPDVFEKNLLWDISKIKKISNRKEKKDTKQENNEKKDELQEKEEKSEEDSFEKQYNALVEKRKQQELKNGNVRKKGRPKKENENKYKTSIGFGYPKEEKKEKNYSKNKYTYKRKNEKSDIKNKHTSAKNKLKDNIDMCKDIKEEDYNLNKCKSQKNKKRGKTIDKYKNHKKYKKSLLKEKELSINNLKKVYPTLRDTKKDQLEKFSTKYEKSENKIKRGRGRPRKYENNEKYDLKNKNKKSNKIDDIESLSIEEKKKPKKKSGRKKKIKNNESDEEDEKIKGNNSLESYGNKYKKECEFDQDAEIKAAMEGIEVEFDDDVLNGSEKMSLGMGLPGDPFSSNLMDDDSELDLDFDSLT